MTGAPAPAAPAPTFTALDLFAGTGWGVACQQAGIRELGVEIMPEARATRAAAGMTTIHADVRDGLHDPDLTPPHDLLLASPPCQTFTLAGRGAGRRDLDRVLDLARTLPRLEPRERAAALRAAERSGDPRTALVLVPFAYALRDTPRLIAWEQVPSVLPVWDAAAELLRRAGYSTATGIVHAETLGVPQTRRRALLIARRDGRTARLPAATRSRFHPRTPDRVDPGLPRWASMADALGWGMTHRPYPTIAPGPESGGGPDPAAVGGSGARRRILAERAAGRWIPHPTRPRDPIVRLTSGEAARLQGFPDGFPFQGGRGRRFLQIGNAVPPPLAAAVLRELGAGGRRTLDIDPERS